MKLTDLVPRLELCERIPAGFFENSLYVWSYNCDKRDKVPFVEERDMIEHCRRDMINAPDIYPAPTLAEVLQAIHRQEITLGLTTQTIIIETGDVNFALQKLINIKYW